MPLFKKINVLCGDDDLLKIFLKYLREQNQLEKYENTPFLATAANMELWSLFRKLLHYSFCRSKF